MRLEVCSTILIADSFGPTPPLPSARSNLWSSAAYFSLIGSAANVQGNRQIDAEFLSNIAAHTRVDTALPVEKTLPVMNREDALVPDAGMNVQSFGTITPKGDDLLWRQIIAG